MVRAAELADKPSAWTIHFIKWQCKASYLVWAVQRFKVAAMVRAVASVSSAVMDKVVALAVWSDMAWAAELECKVALAVSSVGAAASITAEMAYKCNN